MKNLILVVATLLAASATAADLGGLRRAPYLGAAMGPGNGPATIQAVGPNTPAEAIGLRAGDVIVSVDGQAIADTRGFLAAIARRQSGDSVTIVVRRGSESITNSGKLAPRPLELQADYEIEYGSVDAGGAKRRVIVTRPRDTAKHPAILLMGGIGCYSLDGILRPAELRDSYAKLLDGWTRAGYVTMRVEKSGMGDSEGPPCNDPRSDFDAEVRGYAAGLAKLESMDAVDRRNVFLFAHSIGPLDAARVASEHPVRGIVVAETVGTSWIEYDLANLRRQLVLSGMPYDEVDRRVRRREVCAHRFFVDKQTDASCASEMEGPAPYTYMQQLGALDLAPLWKKIDAPVLIIYGTADFVTDDYQHQYLRDMINAFHPGRAVYVRIDGMDHGLQISGTQKQAFEREGPAPFAQRVLDETLRFFKESRKDL